jgi:hypothetical protein
VKKTNTGAVDGVFVLEELEELEEFKAREATPEKIERGRILNNALGNAHKTLREALERASKHYNLALSVDDLAQRLGPSIDRIVQIGGARMPPPTGGLAPILRAFALPDATEAMKEALPADKRRNRKAKAYAEYALSDRRTLRGPDPTAQVGAVLLGMLAIEAGTGCKFFFSRSRWHPTKRDGARTGKPEGPMLHLLQALLLAADARRYVFTRAAPPPTPISLEALADTVKELRHLRKNGLPFDYCYIDLDDEKSVAAYAQKLGSLLIEGREHRRQRRKRRTAREA